MGNENTKGDQSPTKLEIDTNKLDITIKQIYYTAQLNKNRKQGLINNKIKELTTLISQNTPQRKQDDEYQKAASIVNDIKIASALELIMRYCDIIKDNIGVIKSSRGDLEKVKDLISYVESIIWGCQKCNVEGFEALRQIIEGAFGPELHDNLKNLPSVTSELKNCFDSVLPSENQVKEYFSEFCRTQSIDIKKLNEVGHNISIPVQQKSSTIPSDSTKVNIENKESLGLKLQETPKFPQGNFFPDGVSQQFPQYPGNQHVDVYMSFGNPANTQNAVKSNQNDYVEERKIDSNQAVNKEVNGQDNVNTVSKYPDFARFDAGSLKEQGDQGLDELENRLNAIKNTL